MENFSLQPDLLESKSNFRKYKSIIVIACFFLFVFLLYYFFLSAPRNFPINYKLQIEQGDTLHSVSRDLKADGVIRSSIAFEAFVIFYNAEARIMAGDYSFDTPAPVWQVARRISRNIKYVPSVILAIPEGFDIYQIADAAYAKLPNFDREKFLSYAKEREGYFFPDTYYFLNNDTEDAVVASINKNYEKKIAPLRAQILASGKSEKSIITMASIIERESKGDFDREEISSILWKRLSIGMRLQVDAAPITYQKAGLPANPIANPGMEAILASLNPQATSYLYYLHDKSGNIHYAKTFNEHKANIAKYLTK